MIVCLVRVGRGMNRAIRTCASFCVERILAFECDPVRGNLYTASRVQLEPIDSLPSMGLALEVGRGVPVRRVAIVPAVLIIGGEQTDLWALGRDKWDFSHVPTSSPCLTSEAALAIALYELSCR